MKTLPQRQLPFRNQWKSSVLVVWFLALLFFGGGRVSAAEQVVFRDDFNRADTTAPDIWSGWVQSDGIVWQVSNNAVNNFADTPVTVRRNELLRPMTENIQNWKIGYN